MTSRKGGANARRTMGERLGDRRQLELIRRYLEAGMMADGAVVQRHEGTPQGGTPSPLLANVLLSTK